MPVDVATESMDVMASRVVDGSPEMRKYRQSELGRYLSFFCQVEILQPNEIQYKESIVWIAFNPKLYCRLQQSHRDPCVCPILQIHNITFEALNYDQEKN